MNLFTIEISGTGSPNLLKYHRSLMNLKNSNSTFVDTDSILNEEPESEKAKTSPKMLMVSSGVCRHLGYFAQR